MKIKCVYIIRSKIKPNVFYIGSAEDFLQRKKYHVWQLESNRHHNKYMQRHVHKYGLDDLYFEFLEVIKPQIELIKREQFYIDSYQPVFNECKIAGSPKGRTVSEETKKKLSEIKKGAKPCLGYKQTDEHKEKLRLANLGKKKGKRSEAFKQAQSLRMIGQARAVGKRSEKFIQEQRERALKQKKVKGRFLSKAA